MKQNKGNARGAAEQRTKAAKSQQTKNVNSKEDAVAITKKLRKLRNQIDAVDKLFMERLAKRFKVVEAVGKLKAEYGLPLYNRERMLEMLNGRKDDARRLKLDGKLIYKIFDLIHAASIKHQEEVAKNYSKRKNRK